MVVSVIIVENMIGASEALAGTINIIIKQKVIMVSTCLYRCTEVEFVSTVCQHFSSVGNLTLKRV